MIKSAFVICFALTYLIFPDLVVKTKSHARILYGKAGSTLKRIQKAASYELSEALDIPVELYLHVRVVKNQHVSELDGDIDDFSPY